MRIAELDQRDEVEIALPEPTHEQAEWFAPLDLLFAGVIPFDEYLEMTNG